MAVKVLYGVGGTPLDRGLPERLLSLESLFSSFACFLAYYPTLSLQLLYY